MDGAYKILLFTNRNSDNVGDKVIEACDIALLKTIMQNLGVENYEIQSFDAGIIYKPQTEERVKDCDIVIVGGAPMFNYAYQGFYKRTIITIEWAEKYGKPVIFSAIGIESYDEHNPKCIKLKKALQKDCVKMVTTRDGYEFLKRYKGDGNLAIGKVSDPAVFTSHVFAGYLPEKEKGTNCESARKKIGIFVLRAVGFEANGINFSGDEAASLWSGFARELENRGYDYEFLSSGHFTDEAFIDYMTQKYGISADKCSINMDTPENLVSGIASFDGVVSCRLHPSIISFSLGIPSLGIIWNPKVKKFYESMGYADRGIEVDSITPVVLADRLERAMVEGVDQDVNYLMSVYETLFGALRDIIYPGHTEMCPYRYEELIGYIPCYQGTDEHEKEKNLVRKLHRIYKKLNAEDAGFDFIYNSGAKSDQITAGYDETKGEIRHLKSGTVEYWENSSQRKSEDVTLLKNQFVYPDHNFAGWNIRIKQGTNNKWYWYMEDNRLLSDEEYKKQADLLNGQSAKQGKGVRKKIWKDGEVLPYIPLGEFSKMVAVAIWTDASQFTVLYHCGAKPRKESKSFRAMQHKYNMQDGEMVVLPSLAYELHSSRVIKNGEDAHFLRNQYKYRMHRFIGWKMRVRVGEQWFWYMNDGNLFPKEQYSESESKAKIRIFADEDMIPFIPGSRIDAVVAEAVWNRK